MARDVPVLTPIPWVDLSAPSRPSNGMMVQVPEVCKRHFNRGTDCLAHYQRLAGKETGVVQPCPFGMSSWIVEISKGYSLALTSIVPYPRVGSEAERIVAKNHPELRISVEQLRLISEALKANHALWAQREEDSLRRRSLSLHEIRKLNRNVKQAAERVCAAQSPADPEAANQDWVRVWKTAELMSQQFEIMEFLANEELAKLPLNSTMEPYKIFDKSARIYRPESNRNLKLSPKGGFDAKVRGNDKTFPVLATVLIENALKFSPENSDIRIDFTSSLTHVEVSVSNVIASPSVDGLDDRVFDRGYRVPQGKEGSGFGLHLARLVAEQHGGRLEFVTQASVVTLRLSLPRLKAAKRS